ncbi:MAG: hypothetical protein ACXV8G_13655, partial [Acidimicrobiales bacterium]
HRVQRGEWIPLSRRVLRASAAPPHSMLSVMAALLDVGGDIGVGRDSAAALWGLPGFRVEPVHVVRDRDIHLRPTGLAVVHTTRDLRPQHVAIVDGARVTTPLRTIFDLAGTLHPGRTERLLDNAAGRGLCTYAGLHRMLDGFGGRGRAGVQLLRELAADRPPDARPPESGLEARVNQILLRDGQRPLERQVDLGEEHWTGRFDLADRPDNFVLEVQSETYHGSVLDRRRDAERRAELEAAGWVVEEALEFDIWHRPQVIAELVRDGRRRGRLKRWSTDRTAA